MTDERQTGLSTTSGMWEATSDLLDGEKIPTSIDMALTALREGRAEVVLREEPPTVRDLRVSTYAVHGAVQGSPLGPERQSVTAVIARSPEGALAAWRHAIAGDWFSASVLRIEKIGSSTLLDGGLLEGEIDEINANARTVDLIALAREVVAHTDGWSIDKFMAEGEMFVNAIQAMKCLLPRDQPSDDPPKDSGEAVIPLIDPAMAAAWWPHLVLALRFVFHSGWRQNLSAVDVNGTEMTAQDVLDDYCHLDPNHTPRRRPDDPMPATPAAPPPPIPVLQGSTIVDHARYSLALARLGLWNQVLDSLPGASKLRPLAVMAAGGNPPAAAEFIRRMEEMLA